MLFSACNAVCESVNIFMYCIFEVLLVIKAIQSLFIAMMGYSNLSKWKALISPIFLKNVNFKMKEAPISLNKKRKHFDPFLHFKL